MDKKRQLALDKEYNAKLEKFNIKFKQTTIAAPKNSDQWDKNAFHYMTFINGVPFEFHKGSGHVFEYGEYRPNEPITPRLHEVLYSLIMDIYCAEYDFEEFCANLGYDSDSRKAEKLYNQCVEQKEKVGSIFSPDEIEELKEIFQDY